MAGAEKAPDPSRETVNGVRVSAVVVSVDGQKVPVHYARLADRLVFGVDQKLVATVAKDAGKPPVLPVATKDFTASGFGFARLGSFLVEPPVKPVPPVAPPLPEAPQIKGQLELEVKQLTEALERIGREQVMPGVPVADTKALFGAVKALAPVTVTLDLL